MKNPRMIESTKIIINAMKKMPLERASLIETRWKQIQEHLKVQLGDQLDQPPISEFMVDLRRVFRFTDDI